MVISGGGDGRFSCARAHSATIARASLVSARIQRTRVGCVRVCVVYRLSLRKARIVVFAERVLKNSRASATTLLGAVCIHTYTFACKGGNDG